VPDVPGLFAASGEGRGFSRGGAGVSAFENIVALGGEF